MYSVEHYLGLCQGSVPIKTNSWIIMFNFHWPENLSIFLDNLCVYHVFFDLISFLTILFTWWFCKLNNAVPDNADNTEQVINTFFN